MEGKRVSLVPLEAAHIEYIRKWRNELDIRKFFFSYDLINQYQQEKWFERYCVDSTQIIFTIIHNEDNCIIGTIGLSHIDHFHQRAELGTLIGNKEYWGKGIATEALELLLDYAFKNLNLNKVYSHILTDNIGSIKKNQKLGFLIEGTLRKHAFNRGMFRDVVTMGILKEDYLSMQASGLNEEKSPKGNE